MNRKFVVILLCAFPIHMAASHTLRGDSLLHVIQSLGLPVVCITTTDGENPTSDDIDHPQGLYGYSITNKVSKEGRMEIYRGDSLWYDSGEYLAKSSGIKIKHRGNTSAYGHPNKPFKLSLQQKADLMVKTSGDSINRKDKDWVLLNCTDNIKALIGQQVGMSIEMEYVPRMEPVNVILNDDYFGLYLLSENIVRNSNCRIDVEKEEGYIIEYDCYFWNETFSIPSTLASTRQWTFKYPDAEDLTAEQIQQITKDIAALENTVDHGGYDTIIDIHSFARWVLAHDILASSDAGGTNPFVARSNRKKNSLMRMPALWDFDSALSNAQSWSATHNKTSFVFGRLFNNAYGDEFIRAYIAEWDTAYAHAVFEQLKTFLTALPNSELGLGLQASQPYHSARWNKSGIPSISNQVANACVFFEEHEVWMTNQINQIRTSLFQTYANDTYSIRKIWHNNQLLLQRGNEYFDILGKKTNCYE